jgi:hypothetical protein
MANKSNWKGFEKQVAEALGGKRRLRTMESFGKEAPDVYFPKKMRKKYPILKKIAVEAKKRKTMNFQKFFLEAKLKYGLKHPLIILATRRAATKAGKKSFKKLKRRVGRRFGLKTKKERNKVKLSQFITPLVTVELTFFKELWEAWLNGTTQS